MTYMLLFLGLCIVLGLWTPRKTKLTAVIAVLAVALVLFFFLAPSKM